MGEIGSILQQYASGAEQPEQAENHYEQVASSAPPATVAGALADAIRSDQTPPFAQLAGRLFGGSSSEQKAGMLNELIAAAGPALPQILASIQSGGGILGGLLSSGGRVSPQDAQQVPPQAVEEVAREVHARNPSVVERISALYAGHPALVKTLGGAVLAIALTKMAERAKT